MANILELENHTTTAPAWELDGRYGTLYTVALLNDSLTHITKALENFLSHLA